VENTGFSTNWQKLANPIHDDDDDDIQQ